MKIVEWLILTMGAAAAGVFTLMGYAHSNFVTKDLFKIFSERQVRIEDKVDAIIQHHEVPYKEE